MADLIRLIESRSEDDITLNSILLRLSKMTKDLVAIEVDENDEAAVRVRREITLIEQDLKKFKEKVLKLKQFNIEQRKISKLIKNKKSYGKKITQRRDINHYVERRKFQRLLPGKQKG